MSYKNLKLINLLFLLGIINVSITNAYRSNRLRRQVIPSDHIQVHSLDSSVRLDDYVIVESSENRIDMDEARVKGSIWSDHSILNFDTYDTFVNVTAQGVESFLNIQDCAMIHAQGISSDVFFMRTNRTQDGHSMINQNLYRMTNFSLADAGLNVQAVGGERVEMEAKSWDRQIEKRMSLNSITTPNMEKIIQLKAVASPYRVEARFFGSTIYISFADKIIKIDPVTKNIIIFTDKFTVEVRANDTDYEVSLTPDEVVIALPHEETRVCVNPLGVSLQSHKLARTTIERNGGAMQLGGRHTSADSVEINSLSTELALSNDGHATADTLNSEMLMSNALQKVHLTAGHHHLAIDGGVPHMFVEPGTSCIDIKANHGMPQFMNIMPPFVPPLDKFDHIGPYNGEMPHPAYSETVVKTTYLSLPPSEPLMAPPPPIHFAPSLMHPPVESHVIVSSQNNLQGPPPIPEPAPLPPYLNSRQMFSLPPGMAADLAPVRPISDTKRNVTTDDVTKNVTSITDVSTDTSIISGLNITTSTVPTMLSTVAQKRATLPPDMLRMAADLAPVRPISDTKRNVTTDDVTKNVTSITDVSTDTSIISGLNITTSTVPTMLSTVAQKRATLPPDMLHMAADLAPVRPISDTKRNVTTDNITKNVTSITDVSTDTSIISGINITTSTVPTMTSTVAQKRATLPPDMLHMAADLARVRPISDTKRNVTTDDVTKNVTSITDVSTDTSIISGLNVTTSTVPTMLSTVAQKRATLPPDMIHMAADLKRKNNTRQNVTTDDFTKNVTSITEVSIDTNATTKLNGTEKTAPTLLSTVTRNRTTLAPGMLRIAADLGTNTTAASVTQIATSRTNLLTTTSSPSANLNIPTTTTTPVTTTTTPTPPTTTTKQSITTTLTTTQAQITQTTFTSTTTHVPRATTTLAPSTTTTMNSTTTDSDDPAVQLMKLKAEIKRMQTLREWEEKQVSQDHDGDEQVEEFTYPNGTTVQRRIKTRRRIVTTVTHRHKQQIDEDGNVVNLPVDLSNSTLANSTVITPLDMNKPSSHFSETTLDSSNGTTTDSFVKPTMLPQEHKRTIQ